MRRRRVLWVMLACLLAPVALYTLLPTVAAAGLTYFLHRQGYQHVTVQLGYPGWHTLQVPVLSFQKDLDGETLAVTVQDSRLQYDIGTLFSGYIHGLTIPYASVFLHGRGGNEGQACGQSQTATAGPGQWAGVTAGQLLQPLPELPWRNSRSSRYTCSVSVPLAPCAMSALPGHYTRPVRQQMAPSCSMALRTRPIV